MNKTTGPNKILIAFIGLLFISSAFGIMIATPGISAASELSNMDLSTYSEDITFSNINPEDGEQVQISTTIHGDMAEAYSTNNNELIFSDDFESGNLDKWVPSYWNPSGLLEVTNSESHSAPYSMHMQSYPDINTGPWVAKFFDSEYEHIKGETWFYLPEKAQEYRQAL